MGKLTEFEKKLHQCLHHRGCMEWVATSNQQTQALNRLVKKGYATYDGELQKWLPITGESTCKSE